MDKKAGFLKYVFDYPFHIGLPSEFYYPIKLSDVKNSIALIKIVSKEGIQTFDKGKVQRDKKNSDPKLEKVKGSKKSTKLKAIFEKEGVLHVVASETGKVIYPWFFSEIQIVFAIDDIYAGLKNPTELDKIRRLAFKIFNQFLLAYRHSCGDVGNRLLVESNPALLYILMYVSEFSAKENKQGGVGILTQPNIKDFMDKRKFYPFPMRGLNTKKTDIPLLEGRYRSLTLTDYKRKTINEKQLKVFSQSSIGLYEVEQYRAMLLSGLENIALDSSYDSSIIAFDTSIEMIVIYFITKLLKMKGIVESEIGELFNETLEESRRLKKKYTTSRNRIARLEELMNEKRLEKKLDQLNIFDSIEYVNYLQNTRTVRNKIVHMGKRFNNDSAKKAFDSSQKFINYLEKGVEEIMK